MITAHLGSTKMILSNDDMNITEQQHMIIVINHIEDDESARKVSDDCTVDALVVLLPS